MIHWTMVLIYVWSYNDVLNYEQLVPTCFTFRLVPRRNLVFYCRHKGNSHFICMYDDELWPIDHELVLCSTGTTPPLQQLRQQWHLYCGFALSQPWYSGSNLYQYREISRIVSLTLAVFRESQTYTSGQNLKLNRKLVLLFDDDCWRCPWFQ